MEITIRTSKRAKNIKIAIHPGGQVIVTRPYFVPKLFVDNFIERKTDWIKKTVEKQRRKKSLKSSREDYLKNKDIAYKTILDRVNHFNDYYKFEIKKISIRNQSSRWGSCSEHKNLNFNWQLINLPQAVMDYIVVHEICHIKEMNHKIKFWNLVKEMIPNYKILRKKLRSNIM